MSAKDYNKIDDFFNVVPRLNDIDKLFKVDPNLLDTMQKIIKEKKESSKSFNWLTEAEKIITTSNNDAYKEFMNQTEV